MNVQVQKDSCLWILSEEELSTVQFAFEKFVDWLPPEYEFMREKFEKFRLEQIPYGNPKTFVFDTETETESEES